MGKGKTHRRGEVHDHGAHINAPIPSGFGKAGKQERAHKATHTFTTGQQAHVLVAQVQGVAGQYRDHAGEGPAKHIEDGGDGQNANQAIVLACQGKALTHRPQQRQRVLDRVFVVWGNAPDHP